MKQAGQIQISMGLGLRSLFWIHDFQIRFGFKTSGAYTLIFIKVQKANMESFSSMEPPMGGPTRNCWFVHTQKRFGVNKMMKSPPRWVAKQPWYSVPSCVNGCWLLWLLKNKNTKLSLHVQRQHGWTNTILKVLKLWGKDQRPVMISILNTFIYCHMKPSWKETIMTSNGPDPTGFPVIWSL